MLIIDVTKASAEDKANDELLDELSEVDSTELLCEDKVSEEEEIGKSIGQKSR